MFLSFGTTAGLRDRVWHDAAKPLAMGFFQLDAYIPEVLPFQVSAVGFLSQKALLLPSK